MNVIDFSSRRMKLKLKGFVNIGTAVETYCKTLMINFDTTTVMIKK